MRLRTLISCLALLFPVAAQPVAAVLACPPANQPLEDPATFTWTGGTGTPNYRLLLGPAAGSSSDGDTSVISGLNGEFAGLPPGKSLYVTLWSYDPSGNPVQPPSSCPIKTAPQLPVVTFKDVPETTLSGVSLGSFSVAAAADGLPTNPLAVQAQACQAQCKQNPGCQGYTYYPAGNGNPTAMCDLKSQITASPPSECCLSALKTVTRAAASPISPPISAVTSAPAASPVSAPAASPVSAPAAAATSVAGDWVNQFGAVSRIVQKGTSVTGTYSDPKQPSLTGTLQGTFDGKTLRATLNWKNGDDSSYGSLMLTLTPAGGFEGTWTDAKGVAGPWTMGPANRLP